MMSKRVYVAGPWVDRFNAANIADAVSVMGHTITHNWWAYEGEGEHTESLEFLRKCAEMDVEAVRTADVVVVLNTYKSEGKAAEQGIAIALGKPIIVITPGEKPSSNIFHYLPNYTHVTTVKEALEAIGE
jgi:nucleoside 2-deoxyribosyltransferase